MSSEGSTTPRLLPRSDHTVSRKNIHPDALKVLYRLSNAGYKGYLVGGSVRDLMLGRKPKDFDIATDARPNEVRRLFRNSRIIGRRFRLAHILFKDHVVEVSTFRREPDPTEQKSAPEELLITSDNAFGTPEEDAWRRDFTINAMFYDISDFSIIDWIGGVEDLERGVVRTIGDPYVRFREDPVRMMRACEIAGRLGFVIDPASQAAIHELRGVMEKASPARLAEEIVALLRCGSSGRALQWMLDLGLLEHLLPEAYDMVRASELGLGDLGRILPELDGEIVAGRELADGVLVAALLLPTVLLRRYEADRAKRRPLRVDEIAVLVEKAADSFFRRFPLSKERSRQASEALGGFLRLCQPPARAAERMRTAGKSFFADALFLFELMTKATGEGFEELAQWRAASHRRPVLTRGAGVALPGQADRPSGAAARPRRRRRGRRPH